jgi:hypothetical protein
VIWNAYNLELSRLAFANLLDVEPELCVTFRLTQCDIEIFFFVLHGVVSRNTETNKLNAWEDNTGSTARRVNLLQDVSLPAVPNCKEEHAEFANGTAVVFHLEASA